MQDDRAAVSTYSAEQRNQMFPQLTPAQMARIEALGRQRPYAAGELLIEQGQQITQFFLVTGRRDRHHPPRHPPAMSSSWSMARASSSASCTRSRARRSLVNVRARVESVVIELSRDQLRGARADRLRVERDTDARVHPAARRAGRARAAATSCSSAPRTRAGTLRIKEFLTRNGHPYTYSTSTDDAGVQELLDQLPRQRRRRAGR